MGGKWGTIMKIYWTKAKAKPSREHIKSCISSSAIKVLRWLCPSSFSACNTNLYPGLVPLPEHLHTCLMVDVSRVSTEIQAPVSQLYEIVFHNLLTSQDLHTWTPVTCCLALAPPRNNEERIYNVYSCIPQTSKSNIKWTSPLSSAASLWWVLGSLSHMSSLLHSAAF